MSPHSQLATRSQNCDIAYKLWGDNNKISTISVKFQNLRKSIEVNVCKDDIKTRADRHTAFCARSMGLQGWWKYSPGLVCSRKYSSLFNKSFQIGLKVAQNIINIFLMKTTHIKGGCQKSK